MTVSETVKEAVGLEDGKASRTATREEMADARIAHQYRDSCAHLLIPLKRCRFETYYLPWKCEEERHSYEKCQYMEFKRRAKKMDEIRESQRQAAEATKEEKSG